MDYPSLFDTYKIGILLEHVIRVGHGSDHAGVSVLKSPSESPGLNWDECIKLLMICNFRIWHLEDMSRSLWSIINEESNPEKIRHDIVNLKLRVDEVNQERVHTLFLIDKGVTGHFDRVDIDTPIHTETVGQVIDKLSILALKRWHLGQQTTNSDVYSERVALVNENWYDLLNSLNGLHLALCKHQIQCKSYGGSREKILNDEEITLIPCLISNEVFNGK